MTYNIHPIFVHIPIAFFAIYSLIVLFPFERFIKKIAWRDIRLVLLIVGVVGAGVSLITGESSEHLLRPVHDLVEMHALFAQISTWTYAILLLGELSSWYIRISLSTSQDSILMRIAKKVHAIVMSPSFALILSLIALIAISVTGILGGVMVHGVSADPIAPLVLDMLGL